MCIRDRVTSVALLSDDNLHDIHNRLWAIRMKWQTIGLALQIDATTLEVIKADNPNDTSGAYLSMLLMWLRRSKPVPCWKALAEALASPSVGVQVGEYTSNHFILETQCSNEPYACTQSIVYSSIYN